MRSDERFTITAIARDGLSIEPLRTKDTFTAQCGVLVRDMIPISIELWNQPKKEELQVSFVEDRQKADLWTSLKENFTLPPEEDPNKPVIEPKVKACALPILPLRAISVISNVSSERNFFFGPRLFTEVVLDPEG